MGIKDYIEKKRKEKLPLIARVDLAELQKQREEEAQDRDVSILAAGEHKDMNSLLNLSVSQLFDEFERFKLKMNYDIYFQAKMAGAKDLKEVEDWMKDIHSK